MVNQNAFALSKASRAKVMSMSRGHGGRSSRQAQAMKLKPVEGPAERASRERPLNGPTPFVAPAEAQPTAVSIKMVD
jgi:hypothetical protein